jgi:hypothetical protein
VSDAIKPADIIEEIWIREIVGLTWEALRLRRARAALLAANRYAGLKRVLSPLCGTKAYALSEQWRGARTKPLRRSTAIWPRRA